MFPASAVRSTISPNIQAIGDKGRVCDCAIERRAPGFITICYLGLRDRVNSTLLLAIVLAVAIAFLTLLPPKPYCD
jgi:hypothetical protein